MRKRVYSLKCLKSHKPEYQTQEPVFYRCRFCGTVSIKYIPVGVAPSDTIPASCCGEVCELLIPKDLDEEHNMDYCVFGGAEHTAVRIDVGGGVHPMTEDHRIEWIYFYSYHCPVK